MIARTGHAGPLVMPSLASITILQAQGGYQDAEPGDIVWIEDLRAPFVCESDTTQPAVPGQIVHSTDGTRLWRRLPASVVGSSYWAQRTDWHIDPVAGRFNGTGSAADPIDSWRELASRLNGAQLSAGLTTVSIHGNLAEIVDASQFKPGAGGLLIDGNPGATTVLAGTVATYTAESLVAPGEAPLLTSAAVADWTAWEGYRIRFTSGPAAGGYSSVAAANPAGAGLNVARIPMPVLPAWPTPAYAAPAAGNAFVLETLPTVLGYVPPVVQVGAPTVLRGVAFPELVQTIIESDTNVVLYGCTSGDIVFNALRVDVEGCRFSSPAGFVTWMNAQSLYVHSSTVHWSLVGCGWLFADHCVWQEGIFLTNGHATLHHSGGFDCPVGDALTVSSVGAFAELFGVFYGSGNSDYGISVLLGFSGASYTAKPVAAGTLGDAQINGVPFAWAAIPAVDLTNLSGITA